MSSSPSPAQIAEIAAKQDAKARERRARISEQRKGDEEKAAQTIQKTYRGYRERRQLEGLGLDPQTRWLEAVKEARWRNSTKPVSRQSRALSPPKTPDEAARRSSDAARQSWKRIGEIARRAGGDDSSDPSEEDENDMTEEQREEYRRKKAEQKREREKTAKIMDLQYFLEMVDQKHRYGSNLRAYHAEWKRADTNENFFYWLDHGEGRYVEVPTVSRERLEKERVRYLSREERLKYLVKIDSEGRLCWAHNGMRISTTMEWKDSPNGIVPAHEDAPVKQRQSSSPSPSSSSTSATEEPEAEHYTNHDLQRAKGMKKIKHVSAATILNHLLRRSVKPNSWIFVADTSFRLYVGIKQSGAFQHSSFLHGARISAAGLIKIKDGQLRRLSPLSGHYRPPTANFRAFVHSLRDAGVDMSRVSISRSYAVLVGLETYVRTRKTIKKGIQHMSLHKDKAIHPEEFKRREEETRDMSKSAQKEREILAEKAKAEEERRREVSWTNKAARKLGVGGNGGESRLQEVQREGEEEDEGEALTRPGQDAESAIAPEGTRE